jgi:subtilase family serine protease
MKMSSAFSFLGGSVALSLALAGCGGGSRAAGVTPSTSQSSGQRVVQAASDTFNYDVTPIVKLAQASEGPLAFPAPSACVAAFGLACYTPQLIRTAYHVPANLDGTGRTIVIVDAYGSPTIEHDLAVFDAAFGLPAPPSFTIVYPGGAPVFNPLQHHGETGWAEETSLDVEWSHAIAPKANIVLVVAANNGGNVLDNAVRYAIDNHLGDVISMSYGAPEGAIRGAGNNVQVMQAHANFVAAKAAGITAIASSGDSGASQGYSFTNASYPASDPLVTAVGGTNLFMSDAGVYQNETVWNDQTGCPFSCKDGIFGATGGAPSIVFPGRSTSDVAYNASVYTAILVYLGLPNIPHGFYFFGGTSEGAPQWAGIAALAAQSDGHSLGYINDKLAAAPASAFHDVTVGNNAFFGPGFPAQVGYDYPTGRGSPDVAQVIEAIK